MSRVRLFVYGTLRRGGPYHERFCVGAFSVEAASTAGTLGRLPAGYPVLFVPEASLLADGTADPRADVAVQEARAAELLVHPHLLEGPRVAGEIITFDDSEKRLPAIDAFEDFHPGAASLYWRVLVPAEVVAGRRTVTAWAYVGNPRGGLGSGLES